MELLSNGGRRGGDDGLKKGAPERSEQEPSQKALGLVEALTVTSAALLTAGHHEIGGLVALCAMMCRGGKKKSQEQIEEKGIRGDQDQGGTPTQVPKTASHSRGQAAQGKAQDGKPTGGATTLGVGIGDTYAPGLRALRIRVDRSHGEPEPEESPPIGGQPGGSDGDGDAGALGTPGEEYETWSVEEAGGEVFEGFNSSEEDHEAALLGIRGYQRGGALARAAAAGYEPRPADRIRRDSEDGLERQPMNQESYPWEMSDYQEVPFGSSDRWITKHWADGWLIREHRRARKQSFFPAHATMPCETSELTSSRWTALWQRGTWALKEDQWPGRRSWTEPEVWRGYTFFRRSDQPARILRGINPRDPGRRDLVERFEDSERP